MSSTMAAAPSKAGVWAARSLNALVILFFAMDSGIHIVKPQPVVEAFEKLGYPISASFGIGVMELVCLILYAVPRTAILGAVLMTGILGGAISTHVRAGSPLFDGYVFPTIVGLMVWGSVWLRDSRLRQILPFRA